MFHQIIKEGGGNELWDYYVQNLDSLLLKEGGDYYVMQSDYKNTDIKSLLKLVGNFGATKGKKIFYELKYSLPIWQDYFLKNTPKINPSVNHTTNPSGEIKPAKTLFNLLCLDYMEDVDGNYVMSEMYEFDGPLYSQLDRQANSLIAELFFDLRVVPDFTARTRDGKGVEMDGALPMVPAVIHRERPFTNYAGSKPTLFTNENERIENKSKIEIGKLDSQEETMTSFQEDQYFLKVKGHRGSRPIIGMNRIGIGSESL